jgi:CheY-like chemotaxis protein
VSLLGRLEDLSLTDIVQIVFLSRRTGVLEIVDDRGRHTVLFRGGLIVNASSPDHHDLLTYLVDKGILSADNIKTLRQMEEGGIPYGTAALELNLVKEEDLADGIRARIVDVVTPLMNSREGEFNFILSDSMSAIDIEYEPDTLFKEGGIAPQKVLGTGEGEKIKPLRGLEESLKAGKALLRGSAPAETTPATLNLGLGQPVDTAPPPPPAPVPETDNVVQFPSLEKTFEPIPDEEPVAEPQRPQRVASSGQFKVAGGLFDIESPEAQYRNVVLFERNPLVRVAAKRAFTKKNVKTFQYGSLEDVRNAMSDLFRSNSFFVSFLELTGDDASQKLMQQLKRKNPRLPVVLVDNEADLRRRHDLLRAGADLYLTKPSAARLQPGLAEEELALFADELVLFSERAFEQWEQTAGGLGAEAGKKFYEQASKDSLDRSFTVLKQLINELSNPNDISQVSATILGGFGITGGGAEMDARVKSVRVQREAPSILSDVATSGEAHRGKMKKTAANVELINDLGGILPTEVVALPIIHSGRAIGILYGDNAEHRAPIDSVTGLEIFLSQAGYAFGNAVFASERAGRS